MRVQLTIPLIQIHVDREPINRHTYELAKFLEHNGKVPPIHVKKKVNGQYEILNGRHRVLAYKLLGRDTIEAILGVREDPNPDSLLPANGEGHIPQADGDSRPFTGHPEAEE